MPGLVEHLSLQTDAHESLVLAIKILQQWTSKVTHYRTGVDIHGRPYLILMWHEDTAKKCSSLLAPMADPKAIADQIYAWLREQEYGQEPDTDGSNNKGFALTDRGPLLEQKPYKYDWGSGTHDTYDTSFYDFVCIRPCWITYGK